MRAKLGWALVGALVLMSIAGCVTRSSTTEGDREVEDQTEKAGVEVQQRIAQAAAKLDEGKVAEAKSLLEIGARAGVEIEKNMAQLRKVHGPPENPLPFSPENSAAARKKSDDDHASGKWIVPTLTVLGALGGIAVSLMGMPWLAQVFPALTGKIGKMAKAGVETINSARAVAEVNGGQLDLRTLLEIAKDKNVTHGIQDIVAMHAHAHEEAAGMNLTSLKEIKDADGDGQPDPEPALSAE